MKNLIIHQEELLDKFYAVELLFNIFYLDEKASVEPQQSCQVKQYLWAIPPEDITVVNDGRLQKYIDHFYTCPKQTSSKNNTLRELAIISRINSRITYRNHSINHYPESLRTGGTHHMCVLQVQEVETVRENHWPNANFQGTTHALRSR
jgi:hypothetical protein